ncbi:MAG TPA: biotin--[acetyl-CoA-carboxylase] ligase, partial [bacterium]|nr:biotin--[acetyl-CoA-carboxylase] ligase [bacterium]
LVQVHPGAIVTPGERGSLLSGRRVSAQLSTKWAGRALEVLAETGSTNEIVLARAAAGAAPGLTVAAELQISGRGRRGNTFESRPGLGLWVSILLPQPAQPESSPRLSLIAALAAAQAIESVAGEPVFLKWPNDVLICDRKVAGVLVEARTVGARMFLVAGIGINVHHRIADFTPGLRERAASIESMGRARVDRSILLARLLEEMEQYLERERNGTLDLCAEWNARDGLAGREVALALSGEEPVWGRALGIESDGRFRLLRSDQSLLLARSGEASVRER